MSTPSKDSRSPLCGGLAYSPHLVAELARFAGGAQHLACRLRKLSDNPAPLRVWVWGAAGPGVLVADILATCEGIEVPGLVDRAAERATLCNVSTRSFHTLSRPVVSPHDFAPQAGDVVLVAVNPQAAQEIVAELQQRFPNCQTVSLWQMEGVDGIWPEHPPLVVATVGRCGTHWLREMLEMLLMPHGYVRADAPPHQLQASTFTVDHFLLDTPLETLLQAGVHKSVFLYRDPRDVQVSRSYYNHGAYRFDMEEIAGICDRIHSWLASPALAVRYEDLLGDTPSELGRIADMLGLDVSSKERERIAKACSFTFLSGGRAPGQADSTHHYRKGIAGDWRNHLTQHQATQVWERFGQALTAMEYEP